MEIKGEPENFIINPRGSVWNRWEPHIHVPGTILNDQYKAKNPINDFISLIESSEPVITALGITDYYSLDSYERILQEKTKGRLPLVGIIFPNIELRLSIGTSKGSGVNIHLLISPEDPDHISEARRFLRRLTFKYGEDTFHCDNNELVKLGNAFDKTVADDKKARQIGTNQFKTDFEQLRTLIKDSEWAKKNILIAVAGSNHDGTAGLQQDASFSALRNEVERSAHIIFSSTPKQREFWLGLGKATKKQLEEKWNGCKPCLHGSDAHNFENVGKPAMDRYSWIKGDLTFESLRQACIEPEGRTYIGINPPTSGISSRIIKDISVKDASWLQTPYLPFNSGLIAIIGARGSGKTALADFIAAGGLAFSTHISDRSFIRRAGDLIKNETVTLHWETGDPTVSSIKYAEHDDLWDWPKVQYLSQQFVEELCSSEGPSDMLVEEIERIIFQAHSIDERMGANSFQELLQIRSSLSRNSRSRHAIHLAELTESIIIEQEKKDNLPALRKQLEEKNKALENNKIARQQLIRKGEEERVKQHGIVSNAMDIVRGKLETAKRRELSLNDLKNELSNITTNSLPAHFLKLKQNYKNTALTTGQWENFKLVFSGDTNQVIDEQITIAKDEIIALTGNSQYSWNIQKPQESILPASQEPISLPFNLLSAELARLQSLIGIDKENTARYIRLNDQISNEESNNARLAKTIEENDQAVENISTYQNERKTAYRNIFQAVIEEEKELISLYKPLMENLKKEEGTLRKLSFEVKRFADTETFAKHGEGLLDLRKTGNFKGRGSLLAALREELEVAWITGTADEVAQAMDRFREKYTPHIISHAPVEKADRQQYRDWIRQVSEWLYGTDHITVNYHLQYDNVNIKQLSPGTRGIVLLLLYLSIDKEDDRPLIIDQPEENLDPKSIYDELVFLFKIAKLRRQIIIITHNANLVVNTDADQVIVASCGDHRPNQLPVITYISGGLENAKIRNKVCEILEGGEMAFKERAKRLRVIL